MIMAAQKEIPFLILLCSVRKRAHRRYYLPKYFPTVRIPSSVEPNKKNPGCTGQPLDAR